MHPSGQFKFKVDLADDDLLRLPHSIRTGKSSVPIRKCGLVEATAPAESQGSVLHVKRATEALNSAALHSIFCHRNMEKVYSTLQHTKGYTAQRLPDGFCDICARIKAKRKGLRSKPVASIEHNPSLQEI